MTTIKIAPDLEIVYDIDVEGSSEYPGIMATAYYKGSEVGIICIEFWQGKLGLYLWEPDDCGGNPTHYKKYSLEELDELRKRWEQDEND